MEIRSIEVVKIARPPSSSPGTSAPRRPSWASDDEVANPMSRFPRFKRHRSLYGPRQWPGFGVKVTAADGTWGLGTAAGRPAAAVVEDAFAPVLEGEDCLAIEKLWDMMFRVSKPFGTVGIATVAISAVDLALWDLAGKLQHKPVYELIGGPARERIFVYATGNDVDWYKELGFKAFKLACPYGPADGLWGLEENEKQVARAREIIGDEAELMLDCYMAFDVEYMVRLAERLRPYKLKWMEEFLLPDDLKGHAEVRRRVPYQGLAGGEHLFMPGPFHDLIEQRSLDILQPDIYWCGGATAVRRIAEMADEAGLMVCLHGGGSNQYGLHVTAAMPNMPWGEWFVSSQPGVPIHGGYRRELRMTDSHTFPGDGPGFGLGITESWIKPFFD